MSRCQSCWAEERGGGREERRGETGTTGRNRSEIERKGKEGKKERKEGRREEYAHALASMEGLSNLFGHLQTSPQQAQHHRAEAATCDRGRT